MRKVKTIFVLVVATVAAVAAVMLSEEEPTTVTGSGELLFPGLMARINDTGTVEAVSEGETFTLDREDGRWVVPERSGYPAADDQVRELLLGLSGLRRVEPKTAKPERYEKLDLGDPTEEGAPSIRYSVKTDGGATLASVVLGKRRPATGQPGASELFVRIPGDPQAWLVVGKLPAHRRVTGWLDKELLEIDEKRIRRVTVSHPDGTLVVAEKLSPADTDFKLRDHGDYREAESQYTVNSVARALASVSLDDVKPASEVTLDEERTIIAVLETFDGLRVTVRTAKVGEESYALLSAVYVPALVEPAAAKADGEAGGGKDDAEPAAGADEKGEEDEEAAAPLPVSDEVERLNARWAGWAYRIPDYKADDVGKKMADLVKKEVEAKAKEG